MRFFKDLVFGVQSDQPKPNSYDRGQYTTDNMQQGGQSHDPAQGLSMDLINKYKDILRLLRARLAVVMFYDEILSKSPSSYKFSEEEQSELKKTFNSYQWSSYKRSQVMRWMGRFQSDSINKNTLADHLNVFQQIETTHMIDLFMNLEKNHGGLASKYNANGIKLLRNSLTNSRYKDAYYAEYNVSLLKDLNNMATDLKNQST